ncbi:molybdenum cofactor biosynthesis protein F [Aspergillus tetrazonus]
MTTASETPGFIPVSEWPNLEVLAVDYNEHLMAESYKLTGKRLTLVIAGADPARIAHHFLGDAFEVRPDIFFVDFYKPEYQEEVSLVIYLRSGQAIVGLSDFHFKDGQKKTWTRFSDASIDGYSNVAPFVPTADLIGKHILYRYTPRDAYEHIYLNQGTFTWHCLSGTEKGLADTGPCKMLKLDERLYLLFWSEKIMPVEAIVIVDLEHMRSTGRFFCWDPKPAKLVQMSFRSYATVLAETDAAGALGLRKSHV